VLITTLPLERLPAGKLVSSESGHLPGQRDNLGVYATILVANHSLIKDFCNNLSARALKHY
jgi:hypothetical protein